MSKIKRMFSLLLALLLSLGMLSTIVLPASAGQDSAIPAIWTEAGLVPTQGADYLDLTDESAIKNGVMFFAPSWLKFAHATLEGAQGDLDTDIFTDIGTTEDDDVEAPDTVLHINEVFFAKMPTTGIVYKLKYAVTAGNYNNTNPSLFGTIVMFPGKYTGGTQYQGASASKYTTDKGFVNDDAVYSTKTSSEAFGIGLVSATYSKITSTIPHIRVLGPYAGVAACDSEKGTYVRESANEALIHGTYIYIMNKCFYNGAQTTIDGIAGTYKFSLVTKYDNADYFSTRTNFMTVNLNNSYIYDVTKRAVIQLCDNESTIDQNNATNYTKASMTFNINSSYLYWGESITYSVGYATADEIHIKDSVFIKLSGAESETTTPLRKGIRIVAPMSANNAGTHGLSYTVENCYLNSPYSPILNFYAAGTDDLSTRSGIEVTFKDNIAVNCGIGTGRSSAALFTYNDGSSTDSAAAGVTYSENVRAAHAALMRLTFTGNKLYNTTGTDYTASQGTTLYGCGTGYDIYKLNVSNNYFYGYGYNESLFAAFPDATDFSENVYLSADGKTVYACIPYRGKTTDVMLYDTEHRATDFNITKLNGFATDIAASWTKGAAAVVTLEAEMPYLSDLSTDYLKRATAFAGEKVEIQGIYTDETMETAATSFAAATIYYVKLGYTDDNTFTATLRLTLGADEGKKVEDYHTFTGKMTTPVTCKSDGVMTYSCTKGDCAGISYTETVASTGTEHTAAEEIVPDQKPTCGASGLGHEICRYCGTTMTTDVYIPATQNHTAATTVTPYNGQAPTCGDAGLGYKACTVCGQEAESNVIISATGNHTPSTTVTPYEGKAPNCGNTGLGYKACTVCGKEAESNVVISAVGNHTPATTITPYEGKAPNCGYTGLGYKACTVCGAEAESNITLPITGTHTPANTVTPYSGQDATCTATGLGYKVCSVCGKEAASNITIGKKAHTPGTWTTIMEPTLLTEGLQKKTCTICGAECDSQVLPVVQNQDVLKIFSDVKVKDWFYRNGSLNYAYSAGLLKGVSTDKIAPNDPVERGMFVTILGRLHGATVNNKVSTPFTDVKSGKYYTGYVKWASDNGIVNGLSETKFGPGQKVTREQICAMMLRYCDYVDIELKAVNAPITFADADQISKFARTAIVTCQTGGIVNGSKKNGKNVFIPKGNATRAEVATILMNFVKTTSAQAPTLVNSGNSTSDITSLDGKKIMFIGNSFTYYGRCVLEKTQSQLTQEERINDHGYFYQICKNNGMDVSVTNWTWGGHSLTDTFGGNCAADRGCDGIDHASYLTDRYYDYVVIQEGSGSDEEATLAIVGQIMELFREANPNVKFVYIVQHRQHMAQRNMLSLVPQFAEMGLIVVDWGRLVYDLISGEAVVEGSEIAYNKNTFIVSKSEADGYHQNMLSGYITAMMTFSTLTGIAAQGQDYEFAYDSAVNSKFNANSYTNKHYAYGNTTTTFPQIMSSEHDMRAIHKLMDEYIAAKDYLNYGKETKNNASLLDGKKVIFIGDSFTYYGNCVIEKTQSQLTQAERVGDQGYFYQLCKANGAEVNVTNWTFGGHGLQSTFGDACDTDKACAGVDHKSYLTDKYYDYVIIQAGRSASAASVNQYVDYIMEFFRAENPNVKFVYLCQSGVYLNDNQDQLKNLKEIEKKGITVVDWGALVWDVYHHDVTVPGSRYAYSQNTFIVAKSDTDGYHPNMLTGYLTALMTYCAITGDSAVHQPYSFAMDAAVNSAFDAAAYKSAHYTYNSATTNFDAILVDRTEIRGLQGLVDKYLKAKPYQTY